LIFGPAVPRSMVPAVVSEHFRGRLNDTGGSMLPGNPGVIAD
jgi:hypothetical protein